MSEDQVEESPGERALEVSHQLRTCAWAGGDASAMEAGVEELAEVVEAGFLEIIDIQRERLLADIASLRIDTDEEALVRCPVPELHKELADTQVEPLIGIIHSRESFASGQVERAAPVKLRADKLLKGWQELWMALTGPLTKTRWEPKAVFGLLMQGVVAETTALEEHLDKWTRRLQRLNDTYTRLSRILSAKERTAGHAMSRRNNPNEPGLSGQWGKL